MKRHCVFLLPITWVCIFILAGCFGDNGQYPYPDDNDALIVTTPIFATQTTSSDSHSHVLPSVGYSADIFYFVARGTTIYLDEDINNVLARMGEPLQTFDVPSCAFDGMDRFFLFPGVQIQTYPIDGMDRVHTILLTDDSLQTVGGIFIGSSLAAVLNAYGYDYGYSYGLYIFTRGNTTLRFLMNDMVVQTISYELIGV